MNENPKNPLGRTTKYPRHYSPETLYAVSRSDARAALGLGAALPFRGVDLWNAWELSWLGPDGRPVVAVAEIRVPAGSPNIVESKSLKLYLNSLAQTRYASAQELGARISRDLSGRVGAEVDVRIRSVADRSAFEVAALPGDCIDDENASFESTAVDPTLLKCESRDTVEEELHSHLLRSNCPVTAQPDTGSILIRYRGPKIHRGGLLAYVVSFRHHDAFHESCIERIFTDLKAHCFPERLTVFARYNRRGGIDINPFRSDFEDDADNARLWRQ